MFDTNTQNVMANFTSLPSTIILRDQVGEEVARDFIGAGRYLEVTSCIADFAEEVDSFTLKEKMQLANLPGVDGLRNDRRAYIKVMRELERTNPGLLLERLIFLKTSTPFAK